MCSAANLPHGGRFKEFFPLLKAAYNVCFFPVMMADDTVCGGGVAVIVMRELVIVALTVTLHQGVLPFKYKQIFKILEKKASGKLYGDNR